MVNLRAADGDWRGGLGRDAVAKASHVALRSSDLKVVAGVRLEVWDDCLSETCVHLHLLTVILHLEEEEGASEKLTYIKGKGMCVHVLMVSICNLTTTSEASSQLTS